MICCTKIIFLSINTHFFEKNKSFVLISIKAKRGQTPYSRIVLGSRQHDGASGYRGERGALGASFVILVSGHYLANCICCDKGRKLGVILSKKWNNQLRR